MAKHLFENPSAYASLALTEVSLLFSLFSFLVNREGENTPFVLWFSSGLSDSDADGALVAGKGGPRRLWLEWQLAQRAPCRTLGVSEGRRGRAAPEGLGESFKRRL